MSNFIVEIWFNCHFKILKIVSEIKLKSMILKLHFIINIKHYWTIQLQISLKLGKTLLKSKLGIIWIIGLKLNEITKIELN